MNANGLRLFGTLHRGTNVDPRLPAVVLLSPGIKMRVGPGRLYLPLTEMLTAQGYTVLRFDFFGLGDSEGELAETMLADVYANIEVVRYVDDTLSAMRWLSSEHGVHRFILGGLCGGAITALLTAQRDSRVEALLSVGMTVTLSSAGATPGKYMTRTQLDARRRGYLKKLLSPTAWLRLLTFKSEYGVIWRSAKRLFVKDGATSTLTTVEQRGDANPLFPQAFFAFLERGGRALMLFSEKDRSPSQYEEKFALPFADRMQRFQSQIETHVVPKANHVLSLHEWQREMVDVCRGWISGLYATR
jgi:pimeloyl-ACP methyl ester carboxylesterase